MDLSLTHMCNLQDSPVLYASLDAGHGKTKKKGCRFNEDKSFFFGDMYCVGISQRCPELVFIHHVTQVLTKNNKSELCHPMQFPFLWDWYSACVRRKSLAKTINLNSSLRVQLDKSSSYNIFLLHGFNCQLRELGKSY